MHLIAKSACLVIAAALIAGARGCAPAGGAPSAAPDAPSLPRMETATLFAAGEAGYPIFRIPSAIVTAKGALLVFCEARAGQSDSGRIDLVMKKSTDGGRTFSPLKPVWADGPNTCGNPCPVLDRKTGAILLLMTHNLGADQEWTIIDGKSKGARTVWVCKSTDDGETWSAPREITDSVKKPEWKWYATGPGIGIQLEHGHHAGRLIIPCDHILQGGGRMNAFSHLAYSDDAGQSWKIGGESPAGFNECQVAEAADGRLILNMRTIALKKGDKSPPPPTARGVAVSDDGGETLKETRIDDALPEPHCQGSLLRLGNGDLLFSNPADVKVRKNLTVRQSRDGGKTWSASRVACEGWSAYSCLAQLADGSIILLYETGEKSPYERIEIARFPLDWLEAR